MQSQKSVTEVKDLYQKHYDLRPYVASFREAQKDTRPWIIEIFAPYMDFIDESSSDDYILVSFSYGFEYST